MVGSQGGRLIRLQLSSVLHFVTPIAIVIVDSRSSCACYGCCDRDEIVLCHYQPRQHVLYQHHHQHRVLPLFLNFPHVHVVEGLSWMGMGSNIVVLPLQASSMVLLLLLMTSNMMLLADPPHCKHRVRYQDHCQHHILPLSVSSARPCCRRVELDWNGVKHGVVVAAAVDDDSIVTGVQHVVVDDR